MLDQIDNIEKILNLSIPAIIIILEESKRPKPTPFFDIEGHFRTLEEDTVLIGSLVTLLEVRLVTPSRNIQDPPRLVIPSLVKSICRENRKIRRCLNIFYEEIQLRRETIQSASEGGWYRPVFL